MKKIKKTAALLIALAIAFSAFAPAALAAYAPSNWSNWPVQSRNNYSTTYTYALQNVIKGNYHLSDPNTFAVDGIYGNGTYQGVVRFQQDNRLDDIDGIVGTETWGKMREYLERNTSTSYYEVLLDRYTDFYFVKAFRGSRISGDWFRGRHFGGSVTWATTRDGSRNTWRLIMD